MLIEAVFHDPLRNNITIHWFLKKYLVSFSKYSWKSTLLTKQFLRQRSSVGRRFPVLRERKQFFVHLARVEAAESWNYYSLISEASIYKFCYLSISIIFIYNILIINLNFIKFNSIKMDSKYYTFSIFLSIIAILPIVWNLLIIVWSLLILVISQSLLWWSIISSPRWISMLNPI